MTGGALHFVVPEIYMRAMPPYLPLHRELVFLSGCFEIVGGAGLLSGKTRRAAGLGLIVLLLAVWPANFHMLLQAHAAGGRWWWQALLVARLPLQLALMAWVWFVSQPRG